RERPVLVGGGALLLGHEQMARHRAHRRQHALVVNTARFELRTHHALALRRALRRPRLTGQATSDQEPGEQRRPRRPHSSSTVAFTSTRSVLRPDSNAGATTLLDMESMAIGAARSKGIGMPDSPTVRFSRFPPRPPTPPPTRPARS